MDNGAQLLVPEVCALAEAAVSESSLPLKFDVTGAGASRMRVIPGLTKPKTRQSWLRFDPFV